MANFSTPNIAEARLITHAKIAKGKCDKLVKPITFTSLKSYATGVIKLINDISVENFTEREILFNKIYDKWEHEKNNLAPISASSTAAQIRLHKVVGRYQGYIDRIMAELDMFFYNNKQYVVRKKRADRVHLGVNAVGGVLGGVLGVGLTEIPGAIRNTYQRYKKSSGSNKAKMIGSGLLKLTGAITQSPLALMGASKLDSDITASEGIKKENQGIAKAVNSGPSILRVRAAGGFQGVVHKETNFTVGENGPEAVNVTPLGKPGTTSINGKPIQGLGNVNQGLITAVNYNSKILGSILKEVHKGNKSQESEFKESRKSRNKLLKNTNASKESSLGIPSMGLGQLLFAGISIGISKFLGDKLGDNTYKLPDADRANQNEVQGKGKGIKNLAKNLKKAQEDWDKTKVNTTASSWTAKDLGEVAAKLESGNDPSKISSGKGDHGGVSYGKYQLSSSKGSVQRFLKKSGYDSQFKGLSINSSAFKKKWKSLGKSDTKFGDAQDDFAKSDYYDEGVNELKQKGIDLSSRGLSVQQAIFSTKNQYGNVDTIVKALGNQKNINEMSDADIVYKIQNYKLGHVESKFRSSSSAVKKYEQNDRIPTEYHILNKNAATVKPKKMPVNTATAKPKKMPTSTSVDTIVKNTKEYSMSNPLNALQGNPLEKALMSLAEGVKGMNQPNVSIATGGGGSSKPSINIMTGDSGFPSALTKAYGVY